MCALMQVCRGTRSGNDVIRSADDVTYDVMRRLEGAGDPEWRDWGSTATWRACDDDAGGRRYGRDGGGRR